MPLLTVKNSLKDNFVCEQIPNNFSVNAWKKFWKGKSPYKKKRFSKILKTNWFVFKKIRYDQYDLLKCNEVLLEKEDFVLKEEKQICGNAAIMFCSLPRVR